MDNVIDLQNEQSDSGEDDEDSYEDEDEKDTEGWVTRIVYEPWAMSGDLPEPDEVLRKGPELANDPRWAIYLIGPDDGDIEVDASGLTLAEAEALERGEDARSGEARDLATLIALVHGEEEVGESIDKHDEWLAATKDWTSDEIRGALYEEASDTALMGGGLMPVAGWCRQRRCGR